MLEELGDLSESLVDACERGDEAEVRSLLDAGADVNAMRNYRTALMLACENGHKKIVDLLLDVGADVNVYYDYKIYLLSDGATALMLACENGHKQIVDILLKAKANIKIDDISFRTPFMKACQNGHEAVVRLLLDAGADVNAMRVHMTALIMACQNGHEAVVRLLLDAGADVNAINAYGKTPLILACENNHETVVELLLKDRADFDVSHYDCYKAFMRACKNGNSGLVKVLLDVGGVDVNVKSCWSSKTALMRACKNGHEAVVRLLIDAEADVNIGNHNGYTALMKACKKGHEAVVKLLLDAGADVNIVDGDGKTALQKTKSPTIKQLIIAKMIEDVCDLKFPGNDLKEFTKLAATLATTEQLEYITRSNEIPEEIFEDLTARAKEICTKKFYAVPNPKGEEDVSGAVISLSPIGDNAKFLNLYFRAGPYIEAIEKALGFDVLDPDFQKTLSLLCDLPKETKGTEEFNIFPPELTNEIVKFGLGPLYDESNPEAFAVLIAFFKVAKDREINLDNPFATSNFFLEGYVIPEESGVTVEEIPVEEEVDVDEEVHPAGASSGVEEDSI